MAEDVVDAGVSEDTSQQQADGDKTTIAQGEVKTNGLDKTEVKTEAKVEDKAEKAYWPEDWRQKLANYTGAGEEKAVKRELERLDKFPDLASVYAAYRGMETAWSTKNFVKLPGKDAKPEELAEYHKALGVPERPEDYFKDLKFDDGLVLGDEDKPMAEDFAKSVAHEVGLTPAQTQKVFSWYLKQQQEQGYDLDEHDESFRQSSSREINDDWKDSLKRRLNNINVLFGLAPSGEEVKDLIFGGRTSDNHLGGNHPKLLRFFDWMATAVNPAASETDIGDPSGQSVDDKIADLERRMAGKTTDGGHDPAIRRAYFKDEKAQADYRRLDDVRTKIRAKA